MPVTSVRPLPDCRPLLADASDLTVVLQPIVELADATVAGYATAARFPGTAGPEVWLAAAEEIGLAAEVEALAARKALALRPLLPSESFLAVSVTARLLTGAPLRDALLDEDDLTGVVVALAGPAAAAEVDLERNVAQLRERGAGIAVHVDGEVSLRPLETLRPDLVLLADALLPSGLGAGRTAAGRETALVETVVRFADRLGARVVACGMEDLGQLSAARCAGAGLAQGWLLGPATPEVGPLSPSAVELVLAAGARTGAAGQVRGLLRPVRQIEAGQDDGNCIPPAVVLGPRSAPVVLLVVDARTGSVQRVPVSLVVPPSAPAVDVLRRALARPPAQRFDPVVCAEASGDVLGLLRIEDLAAACL